MKKRIFFILEGNNGATYILNVNDADAIELSLKFYKVRTIKQKVMKNTLKLCLNSLSLLCKSAIYCVLKDKNKITQYLENITDLPIDFELDDGCSILISPTRKKIIIHHHGKYFHKFAFGNSYNKVKNEARIYKLLDKPLQYFEVSQFHDYVEHGNDFCSFKLLSQSNSINSNIDLTLAMVEMFNISRVDGYLFSSYLEGLKNRCSKSAVRNDLIEQVINKLDASYKNARFAVGFVHRDFKPWNINDEHGLLIYDLEEAITDGYPLEDFFNYHIDPIVKYLPPLSVAKHIFKEERVNEYKRYLQLLEISLDFQVLLYSYLIERIIFWMNAKEQETSDKYSALFEYIVMNY